MCCTLPSSTISTEPDHPASSLRTALATASLLAMSPARSNATTPPTTFSIRRSTRLNGLVCFMADTRLIDISGLEFHGLVDIWMGRMRLTGTGDFGGGIHYQLGGALRIPESFLDLEDGELIMDGDVMARGFRSDIVLQLTSFNPKEVKGNDALDNVFGEVALTDGYLPDLQALNPFLPADSGLEFTGGTGDVEIRSRRGLDDEASTMKYKLSVNDAQLLLAGEELTASLKLDANLYGGIAAGFYHLTGSTLSLEDVILPDPKADEKKEKPPESPWWAKLTVKEGNVLLKKPVEVAAFVEMELQSTRPLLHLFFSRPRPDKDNPEEEAKKPKWINKIPDIDNVGGSAYIAIDERGLLLDDMVITGDKLDLMARLKGRKGDIDGQIYIRYGILHLGVALDDGKKNFKILKPRKWFLEQPELDETRSIEPPDAPEGLKDQG